MMELYHNKKHKIWSFLVIKRKTSKILRFQKFLGGDMRDRTADLLNAIQALSQLSYTPI